MGVNGAPSLASFLLSADLVGAVSENTLDVTQRQGKRGYRTFEEGNRMLLDPA